MNAAGVRPFDIDLHDIVTRDFYSLSAITLNIITIRPVCPQKIIKNQKTKRMGKFPKYLNLIAFREFRVTVLQVSILFWILMLVIYEHVNPWIIRFKSRLLSVSCTFSTFCLYCTVLCTPPCFMEVIYDIYSPSSSWGNYLFITCINGDSNCENKN